MLIWKFNCNEIFQTRHDLELVKVQLSTSQGLAQSDLSKQGTKHTKCYATSQKR